jgi:hypothetical protein
MQVPKRIIAVHSYNIMNTEVSVCNSSPWIKFSNSEDEYKIPGSVIMLSTNNFITSNGWKKKHKRFCADTTLKTHMWPNYISVKKINKSR